MKCDCSVIHGEHETWCASLKRDVSYEEVEEFLDECSISMVPALLATLITRCAKEPIFKGWMGMHSFIQNVYKKAGKT